MTMAQWHIYLSGKYILGGAFSRKPPSGSQTQPMAQSLGLMRQIPIHTAFSGSCSLSPSTCSSQSFAAVMPCYNPAQLLGVYRYLFSFMHQQVSKAQLCCGHGLGSHMHHVSFYF